LYVQIGAEINGRKLSQGYSSIQRLPKLAAFDRRILQLAEQYRFGSGEVYYQPRQPDDPPRPIP